MSTTIPTTIYVSSTEFEQKMKNAYGAQMSGTQPFPDYFAVCDADTKTTFKQIPCTTHSTWVMLDQSFNGSTEKSGQLANQTRASETFQVHTKQINKAWVEQMFQRKYGPFWNLVWDDENASCTIIPNATCAAA